MPLAKRTLGKFTGPDIEIPIYTCEDTLREPIDGKPTDVLKLDEWVESWKIPAVTAIPRGTYRVKWTLSNRFKKHTLELMGVHGFGGIRVHSGNHEGHTEGCILPGLMRNIDGVYDSKKAVSYIESILCKHIEDGKEVYIKVI